MEDWTVGHRLCNFHQASSIGLDAANTLIEGCSIDVRPAESLGIGHGSMFLPINYFGLKWSPRPRRATSRLLEVTGQDSGRRCQI